MTLVPRNISYFSRCWVRSNVFGDISGDESISRTILRSPPRLSDAVPPSRVREIAAPKYHKQAEVPKRMTRNEPLIKSARPLLSTELYTQHWSKLKYKDDWFLVLRDSKSRKSSVREWSEFTQFVDEAVVEQLKREGLRYPSKPQVDLMRAFSTTSNIFMTTNTGTGKTTAYCAMLVSSILAKKKRQRSMKALVVVPTPALAKSVVALLRKIDSANGVAVSICSSEEANSYDILVGTPSCLVHNFSLMAQTMKGTVFDEIVLDEADRLFERSDEKMDDLVKLCNFSSARVSLFAAVTSEEMQCVVDQLLDRSKLSIIDARSNPFSHIELKFMRLREIDKIEHLLNILRGDLALGMRNQTVVFCKDSKTTKFIGDAIRSGGIENSIWKKEHAIDARVILATKDFSRGLDLPLLSNVVNYDMPNTVEDFLYRIGRVGRLGSLFASRSTSFVRSEKEVAIVQKIESFIRFRTPLLTR